MSDAIPEPADTILASRCGDARDLVRSLRSDLCPSCGGAKHPAKTICGKCWWRLPVSLRSPLYDRIGNGYEKAFLAAMKCLGVVQPKFPPLPQRKGGQPA